MDASKTTLPDPDPRSVKELNGIVDSSEPRRVMHRFTIFSKKAKPSMYSVNSPYVLPLLRRSGHEVALSAHDELGNKVEERP
eukprot:CAMPEP_0171600430 /NCGR_PEP_ID=MMETSP0990-20121206/4317_1 /TAXON_ID=483369 /ORGANISM="non described non described, Strain CCMP2098" /LENGTH=81 /DNA_ID=CAMNT_0012162383 /DNA_START=758 /DNA_END=1003 /DNA_ORIENTATION=-